MCTTWKRQDASCGLWELHGCVRASSQTHVDPRAPRSVEAQCPPLCVLFVQLPSVVPKYGAGDAWPWLPNAQHTSDVIPMHLLQLRRGAHTHMHTLLRRTRTCSIRTAHACYTYTPKHTSTHAKHTTEANPSLVGITLRSTPCAPVMECDPSITGKGGTNMCSVPTIVSTKPTQESSLPRDRGDKYVLGTDERINKSHSRKQYTQELASKTPSTQRLTLPAPSSSARSMPKKGRVADPGLVGVAPGMGVTR